MASISFAREYDVKDINEILQDVSNLGKPTWINGKVSDVIQIEKIEKIILFRAITSAPSEIDALNIIGEIRRAAFVESDKIDIEPIYEAVILADSMYFYVAIGNKYGVIQTKNNKGIFEKPLNKAL